MSVMRAPIRAQMPRWLRPIVATGLVVAGAVLGGCSAPGSEFGGGFGSVRAVLDAARAEAPEPLRPVGSFPGVDPALVAGVTNPLIGVYLESREALATLGMPSRAGAVTTWMSADSNSIAILDPGIVVATRGLGPDLHASEASQVALALSERRAATYERRYRQLDLTYAPQDVTMVCRLEPGQVERLEINHQMRQGLRMVETCADTGQHFEIRNEYWVDPDEAVIWQSRQWLGPELGAAFLQRLVP